ncbi:hypothetical protein SAMN04488067_1158 [Halorubrum xinjiangense]|uniref:Envelope protein N-terminal domain-containing protein n=1 Tax=Halorubrum xinjiangense TaxID=261291 RepID=A0A1G7RDM0_9EURY|nr:hypothetical protein [Halorubrum xinjiangense]SDG08823.1 hypothetical protein SAMN04488067_1158 [Halorubrum xinjiangense]
MRATAVGIGAAAGIGAVGSTAAPAAAIDWKDVGTIAATTVVGGPIALGWALRETELLGSDDPPEGLTADALKQQVYQIVRTRKSTNASTIVDNRNILDGVENNAYTQAKIAAIEQLNDGATESDVLDAANGAIDTYETTVRKNLLKTWNESINELEAVKNSLDDHPDLAYSDALNFFGSTLEFPTAGDSNDRTSGPFEHSLPDGSTITVLSVWMSRSDPVEGNIEYSPLEDDGFAFNMDKNSRPVTAGASYDGSSVSYLNSDTWTEIWSEMDTTFQNVRDGISTWVTNVYGQVQTGDIEISSLITPSVRAEMLSEDETQASAIADLAALNIPIDPEREATITITETGATLSGTIGLTDESDGPIESGTTYDPSTFAGDVYFTADVSQLSGSWDGYESGVDGGTITLTSQPYEGTVYNVTTTAGETVSVPASDFSETDSGGSWSYDASGELETAITEVDSVSYESADDATQYETLQISKEFTVDKLENKETGEEVSSSSFESSEPQTDSNYITQDEWNQLEEQNQELIDKYEQSQNTGGAGGGFFEGESPDLGLIAAVVGGAGVVYALFGEGES